MKNRDARIGIVFSLFLIVAFELLFLVAEFANNSLVINSILVFMSSVIVILFFMQGSDDKRLLLLVGVSLVSPMMSVPIISDNSIISSILSDIIIFSDRIQIRHLAVFILSVLFTIRVMLLHTRKYVLVIHCLMVALFVTNMIFHEYQDLSIYQSIIDFFYILGASSIFIYMRLMMSQDRAATLLKNFISIMSLLLVLITLDLIISLTGIVPWSISYRGGIQGSLYGLEMIFSFFLGLCIVFFASKVKKNLSKFIIIVFGGAFLFMTNIESAIIAMILSFIAVNDRIKYKLFPMIIILIIFFVFFAINFSNIIEQNLSLWSRIGTYIASLSVYFDNYFITGITTGVIDPTMKSNLASIIFQSNYSDYLQELHPSISGELLERAKYIKGGKFIPHNSAIALIVSNGVFFIVPVIYYYYIMPFKLIFKIEKNTQKEVNILLRVLVFIVLFSTMHPLILPILLVFIVELLRILKFNCK
jgi:hypothetical protein